MIKLKFII